MKFTLFKINELPLSIPSNKVGIVSICNNKDKTELHCYEKDSIDEKIELYNGSKLDVKLISLCTPGVRSKFKLPCSFIHNVDSSEKDKALTEGIEIMMGDTTINAPFIKGGTLSVLITVNKGECTLNVGGITPDNELLDYYYAVLKAGDNIVISLKNLKQISVPTCKRPFQGCNYRNG